MWNGGEVREIDQRNQQRSNVLAGKVSQLRSLAIDLENETHEQNALLDGMGRDFGTGTNMLNGTMNRIGQMVSAGRQNRRVMCYTIAFVVVVTFLIFYVISRAIA